jgi:hypothetical protein
MNSVRVQVANDRARRAHGFLPIVVAATLIGSILGIPSIQVWQVQLSELLLLSCWRAAFAGVLAQFWRALDRSYSSTKLSGRENELKLAPQHFASAC